MEKKSRPKVGDVVLLYVNTFPQAFLHVIGMKPDPDCVSGNGFWVSFMRLEIPMMIFTWQLNEDHLDHGFTMNGVMNTLQVISTITPEKDTAPPSASRDEEDIIRNMASNIIDLGEDEFV